MIVKCFLLTIPLLLLVVQLDSTLVSGLEPDCKNHKTGYDSFVCVCTESEPCAKIETPVRTTPDVVTNWFSSRDGARLRKQTLKFGDKFNNTTGNAAQLYVKVNREIKYQEILGFGASFTDATGINLKALGDKLGDQVLYDYFSKDGLEYSVNRVPIGGSDFSPRGYEYDNNVEDKTLANWKLEREDYDYKIPYIKRAKELATHELRLFGSPWSAPKWMKTNNDIVNGGNIKGEVNTEYWQIYAKYLIKYLDEYKNKHNITHWGLTILNEPLITMVYNSMHITAEQMRDFMSKTMGPELQRSGWGVDKLKVMTWDFNLDGIEDYTRTVYADPSAAKYIAGTAFHWYNTRSHDQLDQPFREHSDKFLLATEACVMNGAKLGLWKQAELYAQDILGVLLHHSIGWVDWNMALDTRGGPSWVNNSVDAPILVDAAKHEYYRQPHFYALAQFSKFIKPGSVRVDTQVVKQEANNALVGAFRTPNNSTVVTVVNNGDTDIVFTLEDSKAGKLLNTITKKSIQSFVYYD
ncbi:putative glucosylceramidase 4 [Oppia nitens]|uniref:putative glucosylceramidase 4 n=1 Tax=Oppia nitens TaxID=1686743 RepID=UPI0023D9FEF4|nr:putative glucosylceramidase 4 [Oppia nitens]